MAEVYEVIKRLKCGKATRHYSIAPEIVKYTDSNGSEITLGSCQEMSTFFPRKTQ